MMILTFLTDKAPKLPSSLSSRLFGRSKEAALSRAVFFQSNRWLASQLLGRPPRWEWKNRSALNCKSDELMPIVKKNRFFPIFIKDKDGSWWVVWGWDKSAQWLRTVFPCHLKNIFFAEKNIVIESRYQRNDLILLGYNGGESSCYMCLQGKSWIK